MANIIERTTDSHKIQSIDKDVKNKFKWEWLETSIPVSFSSGSKDVLMLEWIRKLDIAGKAKCLPCEKVINYGSRGKVSIVEHCKSADHGSKVKLLSENQKLPASFSGSNGDRSSAYGIHPFFGVSRPTEPVPKPVVSLEDRTAHAQVCIYKFYLPI